MTQNINSEFSNISGNQEFALDDVIQELKRLRGSHMNALKDSFEMFASAIESNAVIPTRTGLEFNTKDAIYGYHNALVVAESMKAHGVKTLELNSKHSLVDQIISRTASGVCDEKIVSGLYVAKSNAVQALRQVPA
jgi:hypothetical protein